MKAILPLLGGLWFASTALAAPQDLKTVTAEKSPNDL